MRFRLPFRSKKNGTNKSKGQGQVQVNSNTPEERIKSLLLGMIRRIDPEFNPPVSISVEFKKYKAKLSTTIIVTKGRKIDELIVTFDPVVLSLREDWFRHVVAHEAVHVYMILNGYDELTNKLHLPPFYKLLAKVMGYSSEEEALDMDIKINAETGSLLVA